MQELLTDRVVLVSGGTQGLGLAVARAAGREGATVVISGRNADRGESAARGLRESGVQATFVAADVSDVASCRAAVATAVQRYGRIDALVNSAGLTSRGSLLDTTPELFDQHVAINLRGPFFLMQAAVRDMKRRSAGGTIVNILTIDSHGGQAVLAPYVASKAGLAGLTKNAAHAHRWDRIRINGLNIGWTATDQETVTQREANGAGDDWAEQAGASLPMGKVGQVDEIADFVVFLLSDRSGVVTGSLIDWDQNVVGALGP